jgi:hypothetical protein
VLRQYFMGYSHLPPPPNPNIKIDMWHHAEGLRCRITQWLKLVNGLGNTFELNPKWERTLPSFGKFSCDIHSSPPNPNIKVDIWHPAVGLRYRIPLSHLIQLKVRVIPLNYAPSGIELCRPLAIFHGIFIAPQIQISKLIFDTLLWAWGAESHLGT